MKPGAKDERVRLWRERFQSFAESGMTGRAFCRQHGLALATFYEWKRRLAGSGPVKLQRQHKPHASAKVGLFHSVQVVATEVAVRVRLPNGCVVEVGHNQGAMEWVLEKILTRQGPGGDAC